MAFTLGNRTTHSGMIGLGLLVLLNACNQPNTFVPSNTDRFLADNGDTYSQASELRQADYVFSLDMSWSLDSYRSLVNNSMLNFIDELRTQEVDYRIGFIQGNVHGNWSNPINYVSSDFIGGVISNGLDSTLEQQVIDRLVDFAAPLQPNKVFVLEAARKTMAAKAASFVRPGAQLVYVFVSDNEDTNSPTSTNYATALKSYKTNPAQISARALVMEGTSCSPDLAYQAIGTRLINTAKDLEGDKSVAGQAKVVHGICEEEFNDSLASLARNVTQPTNRFVLRSSQVILSSLRVIVNNAAQTAGVQFNYDAASNSVVFMAGQEPAFDAKVEIVYDIKYTLSAKPVVSSIQVLINGASVAQDASNGWTYNATENRIEFHGSAKPVDGADVRVIYQK